MIPILSAQETLKNEAETISSGIDSLSLMESAGRSVAERILEAYSKSKKIVILAGPGNNGGDGLVVAKYLQKAKKKVSVIFAASQKYSDEFLYQISKIKFEDLSFYGPQELFQEGLVISQFSKITDLALRKKISDADILVDALLGVKQITAPRGLIADLINISNSALRNAFIIAVDLPTGMDPTTGEVFEPHIQADETVTLGNPNRGLFQYPAKDMCGEITLINIGLAPIESAEFYLFPKPSNLPITIERSQNSHKNSYGTVLVIGGSENMPGAPILTARAALRSGAGKVLFVCEKGSQHIIASSNPEFLFLPVRYENGCLGKSAEVAILNHLPSVDSIVIGPGMGVGRPQEELLQSILVAAKYHKKTVVLDADALRNIQGLFISGGYKEILPEVVLTPHPGEAAALLGISIIDVQKDRFTAAKILKAATPGCVVLKGAGTVVIDDKNNGFVDMEGTVALATAGSGDVLAGIIAARIGMGDSLSNAVLGAVLLHGRAAYAATSDIEESTVSRPIIASDIINAIPDAYISFGV